MSSLPVEMTTADSLPRIADEEYERNYGYVFGVSGPGKTVELMHIISKIYRLFYRDLHQKLMAKILY